MTADLPEYGLRAGDRLEPSKNVPDVGAFFVFIVAFPVVVLFWRATMETSARHRNPLLLVPPSMRR